MDPISQGALGAAATLSIWGKNARLSPAVVGWLGALSAMAPDLDILIRSANDSFLAVEYHRHFTHSLVFVPIGAAIALLPWLARRDIRSNLRLAYWVSLIGYLTHAPLDCTTTYGTLYFWPFSDHRVSLSWVSVVDPLFTLPVLGLVVAAAFKARRLLARIGLAWSISYLLLGALQKARVMDVQAELAAARGHEPVRRDVFVRFMNQVAWRSLYEADGRLYVDQIRLPYLGMTCVTEGTSVPPLEPVPQEAGPGVRRGYRLLYWFSSGWVARDPGQPELMGDARYSFTPAGTRPFWGVVADLANDRAEWVNTTETRQVNAQTVFQLIFGVPPGSLCGADWKNQIERPQ